MLTLNSIAKINELVQAKIWTTWVKKSDYFSCHSLYNMNSNMIDTSRTNLSFECTNQLLCHFFCLKTLEAQNSLTCFHPKNCNLSYLHIYLKKIVFRTFQFYRVMPQLTSSVIVQLMLRVQQLGRGWANKTSIGLRHNFQVTASYTIERTNKNLTFIFDLAFFYFNYLELWQTSFLRKYFTIQ